MAQSIGDEEIRTELDRVVASREFARSEYLRRFVRCCVEQTLSGNVAQLKEYWLGRSVFQRDKEFNPSSDPIVRVQARRMRHKLTIYYQGEGSGNPIHIVLPVGSYVPRFETGEQRTAVLAHGAKHLSIAVLPFADLERTTAGERFAAILTGQLIHRIVQTGKFLVVSGISSAQYGGGGDIRSIGRALNARFLVEGSVHGGDAGRQVGVHLTDADSGYHVWSHSFECAGDLDAMPSDHAMKQIADMLAARMDAETPVRSNTAHGSKD